MPKRKALWMVSTRALAEVLGLIALVIFLTTIAPMLPALLSYAGIHVTQ